MSDDKSSPISVRSVVDSAILPRIRWVIRATIAALVVIPALVWFVPGAPEAMAHLFFASARSLPKLDSAERLLGWAGTSAPLAGLIVGLLQVDGFIGHVRRGQAFTPGAVACIDRLGWCLVAASALLPLSRWALVEVVSTDPGLALFVAASTPGTMLVPLAIGLTFLALARVLREAVRISDENAGFV